VIFALQERVTIGIVVSSTSSLINGDQYQAHHATAIGAVLLAITSKSAPKLPSQLYLAYDI
jgi:hypothetical protein